MVMQCYPEVPQWLTRLNNTNLQKLTNVYSLILVAQNMLKGGRDMILHLRHPDALERTEQWLFFILT